MYKLVVITNPHSAVGFALAGVDVVVAASAEEARRELAKTMNDDRVGVIAIDEDYFERIGATLRAKAERMYRPIIIPIDAKLELEQLEEGHGYLSAFIKRAVGFDIRLKS